MGEVEWRTVGKVKVDGYKLIKYFLFKLTLFKDALFGEIWTYLTDELLRAVIPVEQTVLRNAIDNFNDADFEELCDVLSSHKCLKFPNAGNIKGL